MGNFTVLDVKQRSPEWIAARLGLVTGSDASDMCATRADGKPSTSRMNLKMKLALERVLGRAVEKDYQSAAMRQGQEREQDAVHAYELITGRVVRYTGFLRHNELQAGCSLDGHVGEFEGIIEAKCPIPATHLEALRSRKIPKNYIWQTTHNMFISGAQWCDWISHNPDFPEAIQTVIVRQIRNEFEVMAYGRALKTFLAEVEAMEAEIRQLDAVKWPDVIE